MYHDNTEEHNHRPDCQCEICWEDREHHPRCCGHCYMCGGCKAYYLDKNGIEIDDEPPCCTICG